MKNLALILILFSVVSSCDSKKPLYLKTKITDSEDIDETTTSFAEYKEEYISLDLTRFFNNNEVPSEGTHWKAREVIKKLEKWNNVWKGKYREVVTAENEEQRFDSNTEFLNYMAKRGYMMASQEKKSRYTTAYTFKRE